MGDNIPVYTMKVQVSALFFSTKHRSGLKSLKLARAVAKNA